MQNIFKRILSCGMALLMCLGITTVVHSTVTESYSYVADAATDYYADVTATKGTALLGQVHDLIVKTHKKYTSYDDVKTYATDTDPGSGNNTVMEFYTQIDISASNFDKPGGWNREHVWPQSDSGDLWGKSNAGSDLHHIRPAEKDINNSRGNKLYGNVGTSGTKEYTSVSNVHGGYSNSSTFEPLDNVKGDAARIIMYVYTHYNRGNNVGGTLNSNGSGTLKFTQIIKASDEDAAKKLLLEWNKLDPVDDIERNRNDAVYSVQGNRNPFIDNETYADAIWGSGTATEIPVDPTVQVTSVAVSPSTVNLKVGETQKLTVTVTPANANQSVRWNSDNPLVASVSSDGVVTAKSAGTANVYAVSTSDSTKKASAAVTVTNSGSTVTPPPVTPTVGGSITITARSFLINGDGYDFYQWATEDPEVTGIACIYGSGATAGQNPYLQFSTTNKKAKGHYLASTKATPGAIKSVTVQLNSNTQANKDSWKLLTSATPYGEVDGKPTGDTDHGAKQVTLGGTTWTVSGNDTYFALTYEGTGASYLDSIVVEYGGSQGTTPVTPPAVELESIEIVPSTVALSVGQTKTLTVLAEPLNAKADVNWTTSDSSVATVSSDGVVTAKAAGRATITATAKNDNSIKSTATVTVSEGAVTPSDTVTVTLDSFTLTDGYSFKEWSQGGFGGTAFIHGGTSSYPASCIQCSKKQPSYYIASSVSGGAIKSIKVTGFKADENTKNRNWKLLTSNTPYGDVEGAPTFGTDRGSQLVANEAVTTWELDGTECYFALILDAETGAGCIKSIEIEYVGNGQGAYVPDIDEAKLASFHAAVENAITVIGSDVDLTQKAAAIKAAEDILATLTADEKVEALEDINELTTVKLLYDLELNGDEEIDLDKILAFMDAVDAINNDGTIEEREEQIAAADAILATLNATEKASEGTDDYIATLNAIKIKLEQDKKKAEEAENPPVTPPEPPVNQKLVAFHNAVEAIDNDGTIEEREAQIAAADAIYVTLTANEKAEALEDIALLTAAKAKLEEDKNGSGGGDEPTVDQSKLTNFHNAVEAIPADGTLEERWEAIEAAYNIALTFNDAETEAAADDIEAFLEAYRKYLEDANGGEPIVPTPTPTPSENVNKFKNSVAAIPSNGTLEAEFNALKSAIADYQKLTAEEKATVSEEIAKLNAAIASYNGKVNSYNSSAETSSDIAVSGMKSFL